MDVDEIKRIATLAAKIERAEIALRAAENRLEVLLKNKHNVSKDTSWTTTLVIKRAERYSHVSDVTIQYRIPYAHVEQQLVDDVKRAKRKLIILGGKP